MKITSTKTVVSLPLWINHHEDSWITEKFPGAIRLARNAPPFAFGEDVAAVHPSLADVAENIVASVNFCMGVDLERLKVDCGSPELTLADVIRDGDALADETLKDEREIDRLKSHVAQLRAALINAVIHIEEFNTRPRSTSVSYSKVTNDARQAIVKAWETPEDDEAQFLKECKL